MGQTGGRRAGRGDVVSADDDSDSSGKVGKTMRILAKNVSPGPVKVSFVLLDWSCRESLHMLDYLAKQNVARSDYEIIWIEYFDRELVELQERQQAAAALGEHPPVDVWAVMDMPATAYYHKHLMYNLGIVLARGEIVCICDSDTMVRETFVQSIISAFDADSRIVLHHDEVRNNSSRFYPFKYPQFEDVTGFGCDGWVDGQTIGLRDQIDPLHSRNYGACFSARRKDLVRIGGADMHGDYLGHICGPYELTFRLVNSGVREVWCENEFLYHTWHPGQAGDRNLAGPHDGRQMSSTALAIKTSGRVEPLLPHPAVAALRHAQDGVCGDTLLRRFVPDEWVSSWDKKSIKTSVRSYRLGWKKIELLERCDPSSHQPTVVSQAEGIGASASDLPRGAADRNSSPPLFGRPCPRWSRVKMLPALARCMWGQLAVKRRMFQQTHETDDVRRESPPSTSVRVTAKARELIRKGFAAVEFAKRSWQTNKYLFRVVWQHLAFLKDSGADEVAVYGDGEAVRIVAAVAPIVGVKLKGICSDLATNRTDRAAVVADRDESLFAMHNSAETLPMRKTLPSSSVTGSAVSKSNESSPIANVPNWRVDDLHRFSGPILLAAFVNTAGKHARLKAAGVSSDRIVSLV